MVHQRPTKGCFSTRRINRFCKPPSATTWSWAGKIIVVFSTMADFRGKMVPALRVRIPPPKQAAQQPQRAGNGCDAPTAMPAAERGPLAAATLLLWTELELIR